jgi:hypothetical protein
MRRWLLLLFHIFLFSFVSFLVLFTFLSALFHTQKGQQYFLSYLQKWAQKNQFNISVKKADILSPFALRLQNVQLQTTPEKRIEIDSLQFRISPLPLLAKKLVLSKVSAQNVWIHQTPLQKEVSSISQINLKNQWIDTPITLEISSFQISNLHLQQEWTIRGKGKVEKKGKNIFFALMANPNQTPSSSIQLVGKIAKKTRSFHSRLILETPSLSSLFPNTYEASLYLQIDGKGSVDSFLHMMQKKEANPSEMALEGTVKGKIAGIPFFEQDPYKNLRIDKGQIRSHFQVFPNRQCILDDLFYINDKTALKGSCVFTLFENLQKCNFQIKTKNLSISKTRLPLLSMEKASGKMDFDASVNPFIHISFFSPEIRIGDHHVHEVALSSLLKLHENGSLKATFMFKNEKATATAQFQWEEDHLFSLTSSSLILPSAHASASLKRRVDGLLTGRIEMRFDKMNLFYALFPDLPFLADSGDLILRLFTTPASKGKQEAQIQADLENFHYHNLSGKKAYLSIETQEPFLEMKGSLKFLLQDARWRDLAIKGLFLETSNREENWPYELLLNGHWREALQIRSNGFWKLSSKELLVTVETLTGHLLGQPLFAPEPIQWELTPDHFSLKDLKLQLASSSLEGSFLLAQNEADIHLHSHHFPIDFLSFNPLNLHVRGHVSMEASIRQKDQKLNSDVQLTIEKIDVYSLSEKKPLRARGSLQMQVADNHFHVKSHLTMNQTELMDFSAAGQLHLSPFPFQLTLKDQEPISSKLFYNGAIEELLDFFDFGTHRISGHLKCQLELTKTLSHPDLNGFCQFENGIYENYYTGSYLKNVQANLLAKNERIDIQSITATDTHNGTLEAKGIWLFDAKKHFPFLLLAYLDNLSTIQTDLMEATASGKLEIKGTSLFAQANGQIQVTKASLFVPDTIPPFLPDFVITYRNHPFSKQQEEILSSYTPYPLKLNLDLYAKDHIKISGKGLNAECNGSLKIEGSYADLIAKGQLNLLHGDYSFSGRVFTLTQGSLAFPGVPKALPLLSLVGQVQQKGVLITAHLKGPLNAPSLTFESLPPLPLSSIMSLLIFGQDISEISGIQAIQLATTIASLSNGSNLLEAARKNLGIDRFTIISSPAASPDESEKIAVQIGKYITKDVLVSLTQGTQEDSSNVSVEVDLTHGFIFQAETMQEEEQSKFTLKWNINY